MVTSLNVRLTALPHASVTVGVVNAGVAGQLIVVGAGSDPMTGTLISCTLMVCEAVELLPHPSVAVHVRLTLYDPAHAPLVVTSLKVSVNKLIQASVTDGVRNTGVAGQLIVEGPGNEEMTGATISCTLMVCDAVAEFPHTSVAVQVRFTL